KKSKKSKSRQLDAQVVRIRVVANDHETARMRCEMARLLLADDPSDDGLRRERKERLLELMRHTELLSDRRRAAGAILDVDLCREVRKPPCSLKPIDAR
ncbi:MAG: hypothetical protein JRF33_04900, partial [Deltaproteobacteria bacterium]|nr:hypothetical protein [Deltaproteobacteria bacterium]